MSVYPSYVEVNSLAALHIWMPFIEMGGGSDVSTRYLAQTLERTGHHVTLQPFSSHWRLAPIALKGVQPPEGATIALCDSRNAFAFVRPGLKVVTIERLFVHDDRVNYARGLAQRLYHETMVRRFVEASYRSSDSLIAMSRFTAEGIRRVFPWAQVRVIPNAVDTVYFSPRERSAVPDPDKTGFRLLYVGNLIPRKGAHLLPKIMAKLDDGFVLEYYTTGSSPSLTLPDTPKFRSLGCLDQVGVRAAYRRAHAVLFPSRLEGMPRVVMEAMACGTVVIGSRATSIPELVDDGINGCLCDPQDPGSFACAIHCLRDNPDLLAEMSQRAREKMVRVHDLTAMVARYVALFRALHEGQ